MPSVSTTKPVGGLNKIGKDVYVFDALRSRIVSDNDNSPHFIVVFGWMGAQLPHLRKYLDYYNSVYPNATQVLIRSEPLHFWGGPKARTAAVSPAVEFLKEQGLLKSGSPSILIQAFSNGGANSLVELSQQIQAVHPQSQQSDKPPKICIVFDSCPGHVGFRVSLEAFTASIKSLPVKIIAYIVLASVLLFTASFNFITGRSHIIEEIRQKLNQPNLLPWTTEKTPRLYLYSDADRLVKSTAVEEHIAQAKMRGLNVRGELFHGSAHVSHARMYPERYWEAVRSTWDEATKLSLS